MKKYTVYQVFYPKDRGPYLWACDHWDHVCKGIGRKFGIMPLEDEDKNRCAAF